MRHSSELRFNLIRFAKSLLFRLKISSNRIPADFSKARVNRALQALGKSRVMLTPAKSRSTPTLSSQEPRNSSQAAPRTPTEPFPKTALHRVNSWLDKKWRIPSNMKKWKRFMTKPRRGGGGVRQRVRRGTGCHDDRAWRRRQQWGDPYFKQGPGEWTGEGGERLHCLISIV